MQVTRNREKCCHAGVCARPLPDVFKVEDGSFVIDADQASDEAITQSRPVSSEAPQGVDE
jgi:ferredoxin